jgi:hypothetical protein
MTTETSNKWRITTAKETNHLVEFSDDLTAEEVEEEFLASRATYSTVTEGNDLFIVNIEKA